MRVGSKILIGLLLLIFIIISTVNGAVTPVNTVSPGDNPQQGDMVCLNFSTGIDMSAYDTIAITSDTNPVTLKGGGGFYDGGVSQLVSFPADAVTSATSGGYYFVRIDKADGSLENYGCNITVAPKPAFTAITPADRAQLNDTELDLILTGTGFNRSGGTGINPTVDFINDTTQRTRFNNTATYGSSIVNLTWVSQTDVRIRLMSISPAYQVGDYDVVLTNPNGSTFTADKAFKITNSSTITAIDTNAGQAGDTKVVRITGTKFWVGDAAETAPTFKISLAGTEIAGTNVTWKTNTRLVGNIVIPGGTAAGVYNLWVNNANGSYIIMPNAFTVAGGPTVVSVSPNQIYNGKTSNLNITGTGFAAGATVTGPPGTITTTFVSSTKVTAEIVLNNVDANLGTYGVRVTNPGGPTAVKANALNIVVVPGVGGGDGGGDGGSSGGSGVGSTSGVKAGDTAQVALKGDTAVSEVDITVNQNTPSIIVTATKKNYLPSDVPPPGTQTYQYLDIKALKVDPSAIDEAAIDFSVQRSWLTQNGFEPTDVVMRHYNEGTGEWENLPTEVVSVAGGTVYYRAVTTGFSYFAISYEEGGAVMEEGASPASEATPAIASTVSPSTIATTIATPAPATTEEPVGEFPLTYVIIIVVLILIIAVVGFVVYRNRQNEVPDWWYQEEEKEE